MIVSQGNYRSKQKVSIILGLLHSKTQLPRCITNILTIYDIPVYRSEKIKPVGVFLDESRNLKYHIPMNAWVADLAIHVLLKEDQSIS